MSHCSCQPPAALTCGGWIPAGSRPSEVTLAQQHIPWFMEHGAPSSWFKPLLGPRSPFPGHGAALCFPLATSNTSQEAPSLGTWLAPARAHPAASSPLLSPIPSFHFGRNVTHFGGNVTHVLLGSCPSSGRCTGRSLWLALESTFSSPAPRHRHRRSLMSFKVKLGLMQSWD